MSEIGRRIDEVIRGDLATGLKEHGYRKSGRSFHAQGPDHTKVVSIQASRSNEGTEGSFTINLGVHFPEVAQLVFARK